MKEEFKILLDYVIKKAESDEEARDVLNKYDAVRTGIKLYDAQLINTYIKEGNTRLAVFKAIEAGKKTNKHSKMTKQELQVIKDYANSYSPSGHLQYALKKAVEELEKQMIDTYTLKVAVNNRGKLVVVEEFPNDDIHAGLHELIPDIENDEYKDLNAGVYYARCAIKHRDSNNIFGSDDLPRLHIIQFIKIET
jgi:DNA-binding FrmR family transcriptional regulator